MSIEQVLIPTMWAIVSIVAVIREQEACVRNTPGEPQLSGSPILPPSSMKDLPFNICGLRPVTPRSLFSPNLSSKTTAEETDTKKQPVSNGTVTASGMGITGAEEKWTKLDETFGAGDGI